MPLPCDVDSLARAKLAGLTGVFHRCCSSMPSARQREYGLRGRVARHFFFFVSHRTVLKISEFLSHGYLYTVCCFQGNLMIML